MLLNCSAGEDSWESLDYKEFKLVHPKGNQPGIFTERTDTEAEAPVLWKPDAKDWVTGKDSNAGKDWRREEKAVAVDEIDRWHHQLKAHGFKQTLGDTGRQETGVLSP